MNTTKNIVANSWIAIDRNEGNGALPYPHFSVELDGERKLCAAVAGGDWLITGRRRRLWSG
jgi:hypothetical protein